MRACECPARERVVDRLGHCYRCGGALPVSLVPRPRAVNVAAVIERSCGRKRALSPLVARGIARHLTSRNLHAYRCPFCGSWHVGRVPSIEGLADLAAAIRARTA